MKRAKKIQATRRASAIVELAICLPIVMTLIWGTIELSNAIFLKQTLTSAAHEGALVGTGNAALESEIQSRITTVLDQRLDQPYTVSIETGAGVGYDELPHGQLFTIVLTANPRSFNDLFELNSVDARVTAVKP